MLVGVPLQVLVTGASGRTGFLTFTVRHTVPWLSSLCIVATHFRDSLSRYGAQKLREAEKDFYVRGLVHSKKGAKKLETTGASLGDSVRQRPLVYTITLKSSHCFLH